MGSASPSPSSLPLIPSSILTAHSLIKPYIHRTPLLTCKTLNRIASTPLEFLSEIPSTTPKLNFYFKCENNQKIGAFKARGAHHAVIQLISRLGIDEVKRRGVVTHSSGNHAQALALAAKTFEIPAYIVMPTISTPSKIAGTKMYTENVIFSGSTSVEREEVVERVIKETGAILVPPYDHPDIILGQGTAGFEMEEQFWEEKHQKDEEKERREEDEKRVKVKESKSKAEWDQGMDGWFQKMNLGVPKLPVAGSDGGQGEQRQTDPNSINSENKSRKGFDAVIAPIGGGGLLGGIATHFSSPSSPSSRKTLVFGAEPRYEGANDAELGLKAGKRIEHVSTLTIADGLRTPVGLLNWEIVSDKSKVEGVYSVSEEEIKKAMRLVFERMKVVVEPSGAVGLAVCLYNRDWRKMAWEKQQQQGGEAWDMGVVFSGGNTTMEAIASLFGEREEKEKEIEGGREEGKIGLDGGRVAQDVAG